MVHGCRADDVAREPRALPIILPDVGENEMQVALASALYARIAISTSRGPSGVVVTNHTESEGKPEQALRCGWEGNPLHRANPTALQVILADMQSRSSP
jgi:hypothetical protein